MSALGATAGLLLLTLLLPRSAQQKQQLLLYLLGVSAYIFLFYWVIYPRFWRQRWIPFVNILASIVLISGAYFLLGKHSFAINGLFVVVIFLSGIFSYPLGAYFAAVIALLCSIAVDNFYSEPTEQQLLNQGILIIQFLITAHISGALGNLLASQVYKRQQENQDLTLLLNASLTATQSLNLNQTMPQVMQKIVSFLPVTYARIDLIEDGRLVPYGIASQRYGIEPWIKLHCYPNLTQLPWIKAAFQSQHSVQVHRDQIDLTPFWLDFNQFFSACTKTACVVPLVTSAQVVGFLSIGESRGQEREPIGKVKVEFLETLANQIAVVVENAHLHWQEQKKAKRLEVLNHIANVIGSTIEMDALLQQLYNLLIQVIPADTYYFGIVDWQKQVIELKMLLDAGERYEGLSIPLNQGLAGYVVRQRTALLIRDFQREMDTLPVKPVIIGKKDMSASWLGVPFGKGDDLEGILAVASYLPNAFDHEDLQLLSNVAQQAALAFDNARHHAEVEERARRDSLTNAYNHGAFHEALRQAVQSSQLHPHPISLIMLDIDHFKEYNDRYGHTIGDEVLCLIVRVIQQQVKSGDVIGRWGGEEFGVILEGASLANAFEVAQCIRNALAQTTLTASQGMRIPAPTISQGIACLPNHATSAEELVEKADRALYIAKEAGRDQIRVYS
jgi:diguanylate cyclase (GGDEF)-like protein